MKRRVLCVLALALALTGCAGAGPSAGIGSTRSRCSSGPQDDQRPLFFLFCAESP